MTRFARAKGSKSSNERLPEDATSWHTMREQMEEKKREVLETKKRKEFEDKRKENYKNFLEERENDIKPEWADFEQSSKNNIEGLKKLKMKKKENLMKEMNVSMKISIWQNKKKRKLNVDSVDQIDMNIEELSESGETPTKKKKKDKLKNKNKIEQESIQIEKDGNVNSDDDAPEETSAKVKPTILKNKKIKSHKKESLKIPSVIQTADSEDKVQIKGDKEENINKNSLKKEKLKKKKNGNIDAPKPKKSPEEMTEDEIKRFAKKKAKRMRQLEKKKKESNRTRSETFSRTTITQ
ncbi:hypothetical protein MML48_8g00010629 [Holotrichia oblita]|uniref:Uncharacterized protein n=1 Tax=Holotrichia oblita TaxID=644536 RepID=A0ACB9SLI2_HOLOL|nr:hypothetical protein MML48_8g00010629 [Holotrichia oblita]